MKFKLLIKDKSSQARAAFLETAHNVIETPIFMPVGTAASVKGVSQTQLQDQIKADIILGNTYHLYLRPGQSLIANAGGIHKFMSWSKSLLTDSGGFQVFSLAGTRKITEEGVMFNSLIDGSKHLFTPEKVIEIQKQIGADIIMAFDECTPYPCDYTYARKSMERTHRWLERAMQANKNISAKHGYPQALFPIVQGSVYKELRKQSAEAIALHNAEGNAIGGLSVGEPIQKMYELTEYICNILPPDKPRYLMGVGTPANILESISRGVDMLDCVMPTRNARNGMLFTINGIINIKQAKWKQDFTPLDPTSSLAIDKLYTKAYLRHLFISKEYLFVQLASIHNLHFYLQLVKTARKHIIKGSFTPWKDKLIPDLERRL